MNSYFSSRSRAAARLNRQVVAAVRELDHPGLLADCACCKDEQHGTAIRESGLRETITKINAFLTSYIATGRSAPTASRV